MTKNKEKSAKSPWSQHQNGQLPKCCSSSSKEENDIFGRIFLWQTPCLVCISIAWSKQGYIVHYEDHSWCCLCIFLECLKKEDPSQWGKYLLFSYYLKDDHISMLLLDRKRIWRGVISDLIPIWGQKRTWCQYKTVEPFK